MTNPCTPKILICIKRIILRAVKGDISVEQSLFKQIVTGDKICPSSSFL